MAEAVTAPYGAWESPIGAERLARSAVRLGEVRVRDGVPHWFESRPDEKGRYVIVTTDGAGGVRELTVPNHSARTRVHEYGGTPYVPVDGGVVYSNYADQRLYFGGPGADPKPLTPEGYRYADCVSDPAAPRLLCVREDHSAGGEPRNAIVAVPLAGGSAGTVLFGDTDFVAYPRVSPDGRRIAFIAWDHPNMPWDTTTLHVADLGPDGLSNRRAIAGGRDESVLEPAWDADGSLYFISDRSGFWSLYRMGGDGTASLVKDMGADMAGPLWNVGAATYALMGDGRALVRWTRDAVDHIGLLDLKTGSVRPYELPFVSYSNLQRLGDGAAILIAAGAQQEPAVIRLDLDSAAVTVLRQPGAVDLAPDLMSRYEAITFPTAGGGVAHAFFYPPANPAFRGPDGGKPPLIVEIHGGPTAHSKPTFDLGIQYWTSRGFAVVDVNYRGSTGFGRDYRRLLNGQWGVVDIEDAVAAVRFLAEAGRIDPDRVAIRGGSAGGFTTLAALAFTESFKAGANYFGVSDMEALARDTHKFESRYLDTLVAPLPEGLDIYRARSPIHHLDRFDTPLITFQGDEDKVVPPEQSRAIVEALRARGVPLSYVEFQGEQHGFRKADTIIRAQENELFFYGRIFGFTPAGNPAPVRIENMGEN